MYDIVENIISHSWETNYTSDQQYIYYICGALIIVFTMVFVDLVYRVFGHFWNGKR